MNGTFSGSQHEMIDSSLIIAFAQIARNVEVFFQPTRCEIIRGLVNQRLGENRIKYNKIFNLPDSVHVTFRELLAAIQECWIFLIHTDRRSLTCLTYINRFNCYALNFLSKITHKPLLIICHGELRLISQEPSKNDINWVKMLRHFYKKTSIAKKTRLIVLGDHIRDNISQWIPKTKMDKIISFEHLYYSTSETSIQPIHHPVRIGVIGFLKRDNERGFENVKKFANNLCGDSDFELRLLSSVERTLEKELPNAVKLMNPNSAFIPREEYNKMIEELDYIYCPYPDTAFKYTASGALLEAISKRKPIIMHPNRYSDYLRNKFGAFGIIINGTDCDSLKRILKDNKKYMLYVQQQDSLLEKITPESLCQRLGEICDTI